jgi:chromosome segregation ATPase
MTTQGSSTAEGRGRSLLGAFRSVPATNQRVAQLEAELSRLQRRVDDLEVNLAAVNGVRDDVRALTESVTEELNRLADRRP